MNASTGPEDFDEEYESFVEGDDDASDDELDDDELDDDIDDLEDAEEDEIDFVIAAYTEDGQRTAVGLSKDLANDLDALVYELRRQPGEAGSVGFVSLVDELLVIVRVRGQRVQVLMSDGTQTADWPIARDIADFLGVDVDDDDEVEPMGDLDILADGGITDVAMSNWCDEVVEAGSEEIATAIAQQLGMGPAFRLALETQLTP